MKLIFVDVPILIEEGSEIHNRLVALAKKMDISFETAVRNVVGLGIMYHINDNLPLWEKSCQQN